MNSTMASKEAYKVVYKMKAIDVAAAALLLMGPAAFWGIDLSAGIFGEMIIVSTLACVIALLAAVNGIVDARSIARRGGLHVRRPVFAYARN